MLGLWLQNEIRERKLIKSDDPFKGMLDAYQIMLDKIESGRLGAKEMEEIVSGTRPALMESPSLDSESDFSLEDLKEANRQRVDKIAATPTWILKSDSESVSEEWNSYTVEQQEDISENFARMMDETMITPEQWDRLSDESKMSFMQAIVDFDPTSDVIEGWGNEADQLNEEWRLARTWIVWNWMEDRQSEVHWATEWPPKEAEMTAFLSILEGGVFYNVPNNVDRFGRLAMRDAFMLMAAATKYRFDIFGYDQQTVSGYTTFFYPASGTGGQFGPEDWALLTQLPIIWDTESERVEDKIYGSNPLTVPKIDGEPVIYWWKQSEAASTWDDAGGYYRKYANLWLGDGDYQNVYFGTCQQAQAAGFTGATNC